MLEIISGAIGLIALVLIGYFFANRTQKFTKKEKELVRYCAQEIYKVAKPAKIVVYKTKKAHVYVIPLQTFGVLKENPTRLLIKIGIRYIEHDFKPFLPPQFTADIAATKMKLEKFHELTFTDTHQK